MERKDVTRKKIKLIKGSVSFSFYVNKEKSKLQLHGLKLQCSDCGFPPKSCYFTCCALVLILYVLWSRVNNVKNLSVNSRDTGKQGHPHLYTTFLLGTNNSSITWNIVMNSDTYHNDEVQYLMQLKCSDWFFFFCFLFFYFFYCIFDVKLIDSFQFSMHFSFVGVLIAIMFFLWINGSSSVSKKRNLWEWWVYITVWYISLFFACVGLDIKRENIVDCT